MRKVSVKIFSLFLVLWYCISIIGFDVHTCRASGHSFVSSSLVGYSCEDIHPEHSCSDHGHDCCHGHDGCSARDCIHDGGCCENEFHMLTLTGLNQDEGHRHFDVCHCGLCPCVENLVSDILPDLTMGGMLRISGPGSGLIVPENAQAVFGIWRI